MNPRWNRSLRDERVSARTGREVVRRSAAAVALVATVSLTGAIVGGSATAAPANCRKTAASLWEAKVDENNSSVAKRKYVTLTRHDDADSRGVATAATGTVTVNPQYRRTVRIVSAMFNVGTFNPGVPGTHKKVPTKVTHDDRVTMRISLRQNQSVAVVAYTESKRCR